MIYYRVRDTGEVLGAAHSHRQDDEWIERYKSAINEAGEIEAFESDDDPRKDGARTEPAPEPAPAAPALTEGEIVALKHIAAATAVSRPMIAEG